MNFLKKVISAVSSNLHKTDDENRESLEKRLEGVLARNKSVFDSFTKSIIDVNLGYCDSTMKEIYEKEIDPKNQFLLKTDLVVVQDSLGQNAAKAYSKICTEHFNKIVVKESKKEFLFNSTTLIGLDWVKRIEKKKDGAFWKHLHDEMISMIVLMHDSRIMAVRKARESEKEKREKENQDAWDKYFNEFVNQNGEYIDNYLRHAKSEENKADKYGLRNKTFFEKNLNDFVNELIQNGNYGEDDYSKNARGWYGNSRDKLRDYIRSRYSQVD